ncbi:MAG: hypothetical protein K8W52_10810 [Deltaproteobacteria bacterium]|nr:hypothetical protein [Deltaproteobacteria bacterium]
MNGRALALVALVACGHAAPPIAPGPIAVPVRASTAGDALLARVPAEADLLIEIDLARAMANPVIGGATTAWVAPTRGDARAIPTLPGLALGAAPAPLSGVRTLAIVAYGIGSGAPAAVTLLVTDREVPDGVALGDGVVALGPPALIARLQAVARGETPALSTDDEFLALRAQAMPRAATGATARLTARLDLDARVALGAVVGSDLAPASLSIWADVADDAAAVAIADGHDAADGGGPRLAAALGRARIALAGSTALLHLGLLPAVKAARITRQGDRVEVIATIGPRRLAEVASRITTAAAAVDEPPPDANRK